MYHVGICIPMQPLGMRCVTKVHAQMAEEGLQHHHFVVLNLLVHPGARSHLVWRAGHWMSEVL